MFTAAMINDALNATSAAAEKALKTLTEAVVEYADAEKEYRKTKGGAIVHYGSESDPMTGKKRTVSAIDALIDTDESVLSARLRRDIAEGMKQVALEEIRLRTAEVHAAMTVASAFKQEAKFEQTRTQITP